jgi:hypothetical protein
MAWGLLTIATGACVFLWLRLDHWRSIARLERDTAERWRVIAEVWKKTAAGWQDTAFQLGTAQQIDLMGHSARIEVEKSN